MENPQKVSSETIHGKLDLPQAESGINSQIPEVIKLNETKSWFGPETYFPSEPHHQGTGIRQLCRTLAAALPDISPPDISWN